MAFAMGIDCGTTGIRVVIYDDDGSSRGVGKSSFNSKRPYRGYSEQDPAEWWNGLKTSIRMAINGLSRDEIKEIKAIGVTATGPSLVFADEFGNPIRPCMMWDDIRATECVQDLNLNHESLVAKALWASINVPEDFEKSKVLCDATEWLIWKLTGKLSVNKLSNFPIADQLKLIDENSRMAISCRLPKHEVEVGGIAGQLLPEEAERLNLPPGIPIINATRDAFVYGLSLGLIDRRSIGCVGGSSNLVQAMTDEEKMDLRTANFYPPGILHPRYSLISGAHYSGIVWDWWKNFRGDFIKSDLQKADEIPAGSSGIVFSEWFHGNRMPWRDPYLTGSIWGLSLHHRPEHIARSILEGIAFGTRLIFDEIASIPAMRNREVRVTGGLTNIPLYNKILASVLNRPLTIVKTASGSAAGAAIFAAQAVGMNRLVHMEHPTFVVEPDEQHAKIYNQFFSYYVETADRMKGLMHKISKATFGKGGRSNESCRI